MTNHPNTLDAPPATKQSSMRLQVLFIVGLFISASIALMCMGYIQSETLNSVRAFVRGEGLWGKAQKDATFLLERYVHTTDLQDYTAFKTALSINLGDKQARLALLETPPNLEQARQGFLQGDNHPDDIDSMITFFLRFQNFYYMKEARKVWATGDVKILELFELGEKIHQCIDSQAIHCLAPLTHELDKLNEELNTIAIKFSLVLSEGARWIKSTLLTASIILIGILSLGIYVLTQRIIHNLDIKERALMVSENRFLSLYNANVIGLMDWHEDGRVLAANDAYLNLIGYSREELEAGKINWTKLTPRDYVSLDETAMDELKEKGVCTTFEKELIHKQGHRVPIYMGAASLTGSTKQGICFIVDQSQKKLTETQLKLSATVFDASSDGIIITDEYKHVVAVNKVYCKRTGYTEAQLLGSTPPILISNLMPDTFYEEVSKTLIETDQWQGDALDRTTEGDVIPVHVRINTVRDHNYKITHYVASLTDISERKAAEEQLRKLAHYDYLTGLANRSLYHDRLNQALIRAKRHQNQLALLFFDLDKFKPINDEHGHEVGDLLLQVVAARITNQVRTNDTVARLGGDEFVIIMEELSDIQHAAELANKIIQALSQPCKVKDHTIKIGCSVGISIYPQDGQDPISLTRNADIAMYAAKGSGRNQYYFFNSDHT